MEFQTPCLRLLVISLSLLLLSMPSSGVVYSPCDFPAIFNFGDSNSDTGAEKLGLPYLSAYLGSNFTHGANFATGGFNPVSLNVQWYQFAEFITRSQTVRQRGGVYKELMPRQEYFGRALYTFDIGQNDLAAGYYNNMSTAQVKKSFPDILAQLSTIIKDIYEQGGRYIWIHNTGPVGCLPYVLDQFLITAVQIDNVGCATPFNQVAQFFNSRLLEMVIKLRKDLPSAAITYIDVYKVKYLLISQAKRHGFEHPLRACCGHGGKYNFNPRHGCGSKVTVNGTKILLGKSCQNPLARINWDGVHYTEARNKFVFEQIVDGAYSDPPIPLHMACRRVNTGS
ncbi:hypothetical protein MKW94_017770 [Papaver nudicaule]|uniref:GDSL esterase/lipase n=1 Tax=Papaver nudicaule TaxID=74823 RepID=A0AA42AS90_PAPNU|nr:hypothetical protein [Papaver nudicaule]